MTEPTIYTRAEMAEKLNISKRTIYRWEERGVLTPKYHPAKNTYYYTNDDYNDYVERLKNGSLSN